MSRGTVQAAPHFNAVEDAATLEKAMKGVGTDEQAIIDLLTKRSVSQRQQIAVSYKSQYGKDLKSRLHSELSGNFRRAVEYSFYDKAHVNAKALYKAMKGAGTDERILIDVICTASNTEIEELKRAYADTLSEENQNTTRRNLEKDVQNDTSGDFRCILIALLQGKRQTTSNDVDIAKDCEDLYKGGEAKLGTDESTFTRILATRSYQHIQKVNEKYTQATGHDLLKALDNEVSGDYGKCLKTIVKCALNKTTCLAELLMDTMEGAGTHDDNLIRMIMAHSEVDLANIMQIFDSSFEKTLPEMIKGDTSGDYLKFLLGIVGF